MTAVTRIRWTCDACHNPIFGDTGYLSATYEAIRSSYPIFWRALHDRCVADDGAYSVDIAQLSSPEQVMSWTAHLAGKSWYSRSNWRAVMAAHGIDVTPEERDLSPRPWAVEEMRRTGRYGPVQ